MWMVEVQEDKSNETKQFKELVTRNNCLKDFANNIHLFIFKPLC